MGEVWRLSLKEVGKLGEELQMAGVQSAHPDRTSQNSRLQLSTELDRQVTHIYGDSPQQMRFMKCSENYTPAVEHRPLKNDDCKTTFLWEEPFSGAMLNFQEYFQGVAYNL